MPAVVLGNCHEFRPRARTIHAYALRVRTKMTPPSEAIATMFTCDVPLAHDKIARCEPFHMVAHLMDNTDKFVANCHRHRNGFLRPCVPVVNVKISTADRRFQNPNEHVVPADFRNRNLIQPQPRLGPGLHDGMHRSLHGKKLSESGIRETKFVGRQCIGSRCVNCAETQDR